MSDSTMERWQQRALVLAVAAGICASPGAWAQGLEEVLVTAQKREQGLQDVPISVEAFGAEQIDNLAADDISGLGDFTPNVDIGKATNQPSYKIRGIGTDDFGIGADPAVGVYVDGVYIGRSGGSKVAFNDIARVEILNGPQGTLFGRNAAAGAIQYVTNKPVDEYEGWVKATLGNYDRRQLEGVFNVPITDTLYFRTGLLYNKRDGWVDNLANGDDLAREDNRSITAQLRWLPTDNLDIILRAEYDEVDQDSRPASSAVWGPRDNGAGFTEVESDERLQETRELYGTSLHVTYDMDFATLTSITAWRTYDSYNPEEKDGSAELLYRFNDLNKEDNKQFSQEFRLDGEFGSRWRWTAGVNYFREHARQQSGIILGPESLDKLIAEREIGVPYDALAPGQATDIAFQFIPDPYNRRAFSNGYEAFNSGVDFRENIFIDGEYESYAGFVDTTFDILDNLSLTAGLRYTEDEKQFGRYVEFNEYALAFGFPTETRIDANGNYDPDGELGYLVSEESWSQLTPRLVLDWRVTDDVLLYGSYSEGYKAGGFNSAGEILAPPFDPEEVTNYELGVKSSWLDNTLRVNAAAFYYEYDNLQELNFIQAACLSNSSTGAYLFETSDVEGEGMELSVNWLPIPSLELFFNTGLLDAEYVRREERTVVDGSCEVIDRSGETFSESPDVNFSVGGTYTLDFDNGAQLMFSAAYSYAQGTERNSCVYVVNNRALGRPSDVYTFTELDGELTLSDDSATGDLDAPPFDACPDSDDREQLNARMTYLSPERHWEVAAFVVNATDWEPEHEDPGGLGGELASDFSDGSPSWTRRDEPRMYGVELRYNF
ncbi:TonB-dependent receptor [Parahaliea mediterranea]|uniref:TonB-dependent receptor n=1 Tax=Parahaliea mediterranea TaxID=651086 RepID=A0A939DHZ7_9GAMM|nr:TonB-dependent receptor [Parahaliea mediterranea]MBN7798459.1 TonB-dependent receptor [Parahaliea mediterranea]